MDSQEALWGRSKPRRKKRSFSRSKYYVGRGFIMDCRLLLTKCFMSPRMDWESFQQIILDMGFPTILNGREYFCDTIDFAEEAISIVKIFFFKKYLQYRERVCVLYLLYTLLSFQPLKSFAYVWFTVEDLKFLKKFEIEARERKDLEVLYCLGDLIARGHIKFTKHPIECGYSACVHHYHTSYISEVKRKMTDEELLTSEDVEGLSEIAQDFKNYEFVKKAVVAHSMAQGEKETLSYVKDETIDKLCEDFMKLQAGSAASRIVNLPSASGSTSMDVDRSEMIAQHKSRAMKNAVGNARYLRTVQ